MSSILVLHDSPTIRELFSDLLTLAGYTVQTCPLAAPLLHPLRADLIILHIPPRAPVPAWELLARLTDDPSTAPIPLLVCSTAPMLLATVQQPTFREPFEVDALLDLIASQLRATLSPAPVLPQPAARQAERASEHP